MGVKEKPRRIRTRYKHFMLGRFEVTQVTNGDELDLYVFDLNYIPEMKELLHKFYHETYARESLSLIDGSLTNEEMYMGLIGVPNDSRSISQRIEILRKRKIERKIEEERAPVIILYNEGGEQTGYYHIRDCTLAIGKFDENEACLEVNNVNRIKRKEVIKLLEDVFR